MAQQAESLEMVFIIMRPEINKPFSKQVDTFVATVSFLTFGKSHFASNTLPLRSLADGVRVCAR